MSILGPQNDCQHGLAVEFTRQHDRYRHVISMVRDGMLYPLLQSIEGDSASLWPPSPPLQQLSLETTTAGEQVALLLGMAGTSHWSLSIEASHEPPKLVFDAACRVNSPAGTVGSSYTLQSGSWQMNDDGTLHIDAFEHVWILRGLMLSEKPILATAGNRCQVSPAVECTPGVTLRWKYSLEWADRS